MAVVVFLAMSGLAMGDDPGGGGMGAPPPPSIDFIGGTPKAGGFAGQVTAAVEWKSCTGINSVEVGIYKTVNGQQKVVKTVSVNSGKQQPLLADGTYTWNIATGEAAGTKITSATADVFDVNDQAIPAQKQLNNLNVIVP